jgi:hypothetical protein
MLGAGWWLTTSPLGPTALAIMIQVPWDRTNQRIPVTVVLRDQDGRDVELGDDDQKQTIEQVIEIEVGRPAGVAAGSMLPASLAINVPPLPLPVGRYEWVVKADGLEESESFEVRA